MSDQPNNVNNQLVDPNFIAPITTPPDATTKTLTSDQTGKQIFADPRNMPLTGALPAIIYPERTRQEGNYTIDVVATSARIPGVPDAWPATYAYYRIMLANATVRLARAVANAPILTSKWSYEADKDAPDGAKDFIQSQMSQHRRSILQHVLLGVDFGWIGFEKVFESLGNQVGLKRLKPLLHEVTEILVDQDSGEWTGLINRTVAMPREKCMLFTYDQEAGNLYGRGKCENLRFLLPVWKDAQDGAARYDRKIAGVFPLVHFPPGTSKNKAGEQKDNYELAVSVLANISGGKGIAVPNEFATPTDDRQAASPEKRRWLIELLEDKGSRQPGFIERLRYLDSLIMRAYLVPERAATEGQAGTKAEAETHAGLVIQMAQLLHDQIADEVNRQVVDQLMMLNYGTDAVGTVFISPMPVVNETRDFVRQVLQAVLTQGASAAEILLSTVNLDALLDMAELPKIGQTIDQASILNQVESTAASRAITGLSASSPATKIAGIETDTLPAPSDSELQQSVEALEQPAKSAGSETM